MKGDLARAIEVVDLAGSLREGDLVLVRFGSGGTQVARVTGTAPLRARKWKDNSGGWTAPRAILPRDLRGVPSSRDPRLLRIARWQERLLAYVGPEVSGGSLLPSSVEEGDRDAHR